MTEGQAADSPKKRRKRNFGVLFQRMFLLALLIWVGVFVVPQVMRKAEVSPHRNRCKSNLRNISLGAQLFAEEHDGRFPETLEEMFPVYVDARKVLRCPEADGPEPHYTLEPSLRTGMPDSYILAYDRSADNHDGAGFYVAFLDVHAEWWKAERETEFRERLKKQRTEIEKLKAAEEKPE